MTLAVLGRDTGGELPSKIKSVPELARLIGTFKRRGLKVAHCHGVFDVVHPGHIRHLAAAKAEGDILVVTITADKFVDKGPGRPAFNEQLRTEALAALACVDYVAINRASNAVDLILALKPDIYVKGSDYVRREDDPTGKIQDEEQAILACGGRIHFTDEITFSSSSLINAHFGVFPPETEAWLYDFRRDRSAADIMRFLDAVQPRKALVIGEPIIDEYVFCHGLGKATKDPVLAVQYRACERHAGGSLAVANHLAGLVSQVGLIAQIGEIDGHEEFIRRQLRPNVTPYFTYRHNAPTIQKRRFVDHHTGARMFELYVMDDSASVPADIAALVDRVQDVAGGYDLVVVTDYGHGMMTPPVVEAVTRASKFLSVNTQINAGNRGFNTVSKYPRADYVCLAAHELEVETRMPHATMPELAALARERIACSRFTVTRGKAGSVHFDGDGDLVEAPALATEVVDRVGAGDTVLAVTSALVAEGAPWDIVGFVGNIAGGQAVTQLGNRQPLSRASLVKAITALMK
ncbi:MAG: adenylyltransferase/cytidyltransferase family protein [Hyphomicrobiales bacterium]|nr:adenylyltransferase/cytidyltransferase family protein [Hyphomicrobiales bacterium]